MPQRLSDEFGPFGRNLDPSARIHAAIRAAGFDHGIENEVELAATTGAFGFVDGIVKLLAGLIFEVRAACSDQEVARPHFAGGGKAFGNLGDDNGSRGSDAKNSRRSRTALPIHVKAGLEKSCSEDNQSKYDFKDGRDFIDLRWVGPFVPRSRH